MYAGTGEFMPTPDVALSVRKITAQACGASRVRAFELARRRRKLVTAVHKANNFILTDGLFLREVREVARVSRTCGWRRSSSTRWPRGWCAIPAAST